MYVTQQGGVVVNVLSSGDLLVLNNGSSAGAADCQRWSALLC